ncbi:phage Gp37/Gp68 family protein [Burkholderia pseudomallei MSHR435]|nr:phage Gp37/Gp68 family protein [Burkholderia pseudomallei MSHR449]KGX74979.1 phage Gp37/Gp68 family protein [Burkholderia pseudomallei MSHR435]
MSENSKIEWCDHTLNLWDGCRKVGSGCDHCYAEACNARFGGSTAVN